MSKSLFNQNTFNSKNLSNSNVIGNLKLDDLKVTNATITNLTNNELQTATIGVGTNAAAISTNVDDISQNAYDISLNTDAINLNIIDISQNTYDISQNTYDILLNTDAINDNTTAISGKQDILSAGDGINISSNEVSLDGTRTGSFTITGKFSQGGTDFLMWNSGRGGSGTSSGRALVHSNTGTASKETSILRLNYNGDFGAGTQLDSVVGIKTLPDSSYDLKVNGNTDIGGVLSINGISNVRTSIESKQDTLTPGDGIDITGNTVSFDGNSVIGNITTTGTITGGIMNYVNGGVVTNIQTEIESKQDTLTDAANAGTNISISASGVISSTAGTYTAANNGGLALSAGAFSLDFSNTNSQISIPQEVYIKEGLILDAYNMGRNTFDNNTDGTTRDNIYIKFAPSTTVGNDWCYLRNIGTSNAGHLTFDFFDDGNDTRFSIRNIKSSGENPDVITEVFDVFSSGVTARCPVYRYPRMMFYNFYRDRLGTNSVGSVRWGADETNGYGFQDEILNTRTTGGSAFSSHSNGIISFNTSGYYRIRVSANPQLRAYNDRVAFMIWLVIGSNNYRLSQSHNFFGWSYMRNTSDGAHGNIVLEDYRHIGTSETLQIRNAIDINNRNFDDSLAQNEMYNYLHLQIELITEDDI